MGVMGSTMEVIGSSDIRARNSSLMLKLIWERRQISRAEIARQMGLSRSTVSAIVNTLMETGLLRTCGAGESLGGRRPILLGFDDDAFLLVGAEIGATHIGVALTNLRAEIQAWRHTRHPVRDDPEGTLHLLGEFVRECVAEVGADMKQLVGVGVGVPSPIDPGAAASLSPLIHPSWRGVNAEEALGEALPGLPLFIENDANLGALAERWWGEGRDGRDLAYIKVATGIGAGYIVDGRIHRGVGGFAGEIGHTTITTRSRSDSLYDLIGTEALVARAERLLKEHPSSLLTGREVTLEAIIEATRAGDLLGRQLIDEVGTYLGIAIANMLNLLNPATIVLGGSIASLDEILLHPVRRAIRDRTLWATIAQSRLVTSRLGERAIAVGAATRVLQAALNNHELFPMSGEPIP